MYKIIKRKSPFFIPFIIIILSSPTDAISPSSSSPCRVSIVCSAHHPQVSRRRCRCPDYSLFNILMTASIQRPGYNGIDPAEIIKPNGTKWVPYYVHVPIPPTHATKTRPRIRELRRRLHLNMYVLLGRRKSEGIKDVSCPFDGSAAMFDLVNWSLHNFLSIKPIPATWKFANSSGRPSSSLASISGKGSDGRIAYEIN